MSWLTETPRRIVRACLAMLPRLQAEESLLAVRRTGLGVGAFARHDARKLTEAWVAAAHATPSGRRPTQHASPDILATMGIGVRVTA